MTDPHKRLPTSVENAGKVLAELRLAHGMLHPDESSPILHQWYSEISEAMAIQESFFALLQKSTDP